MTMRHILLVLALFAAPAAAQAADVTGNWLTGDKSALVVIARCGEALCGTIAKVLIERPGYPKTDVRNPDPKLRNRPIEGLRILSGFSRRGDKWEGGRIYDPRSGKSYASKMALNSDGSLNVSGCIPIFCKTVRWTRAR
ncbi:MAG TPA: DUF2147 domain-containing protein [Allosphingosinicella sp.]|jgi:uncharacterized protein (DUF2147 family)